MRVLVACEFSARVRDEFRLRGHDAWSCDLEPTLGNPQYHILGDVRSIINHQWDLMIAFPPCTYLTKSNAWRWDAIKEQREEALDFVRLLLTAPIQRIAVENPVGAIGTHIRRADQYIEPWQFGDPYQKKTGLWLKGLLPLTPLITTKSKNVRHWCQGNYGTTNNRKTAGVHRKSADRSLTFPGIATAMATQWGLENCAS